MKKIDLIFLNNSFDLDLIKSKKIKLNDLHVLTINPAIERLLHEKKNNYLKFNSFLKSSNLNRNLEKSISLVDKLSSIGMGYSFYGIELFKLLRIHFLSDHFFRTIFNTRDVLNSIQNHFIINSFSYINFQKKDNPSDISYIVNSFLKAEFSRLNIKVNDIFVDYTFESKNIVKNPPMQKNLYGLKNDINTKTDLLFIIGENTENDDGLLNYVDKDNSINTNYIIRHHRRSDYTYYKNFNPIYFYDFEYESEIENKAIRMIDEKKDDFIKSIKNNNDIDLDVKAEFSLEFISNVFFGQSKHIVKDLITFDRILKNFNPSQIYFSHSWDTSTQAMIKYAKKFGINCHIAIHGGIIINDGYKHRVHDTDNYYVASKDNYNGLIKAGQKKDTIKIVGSTKSFGRKFVKEKKSKISLNKNPKKLSVYFFTSDTVLVLSKNFLDSIYELIKLAKNNPHAEYFIKQHPRFDLYDLWIDLKSSFPNNLIVLDRKVSLDEIIDMIDVGILFNNPSNIAMELVENNIPIIYLKDNCFSIKGFESMLDSNEILNLYSISELEKILKYFVNDEKFRKKLLTESNNFYKSFVNSSQLMPFENIKNNILKAHQINQEKKTKHLELEIINKIKLIILNKKVNTFSNSIKLSEKFFVVWIIKLILSWLDFYKISKYKIFYYYYLVIKSLSNKKFIFMIYTLKFGFSKFSKIMRL